MYECTGPHLTRIDRFLKVIKADGEIHYIAFHDINAVTIREGSLNGRNHIRLNIAVCQHATEYEYTFWMDEKPEGQYKSVKHYRESLEGIITKLLDGRA